MPTKPDTMSGPSTYTRIAAPIASSESRETARAQSNSDLPSPAQSSSIIRELAIVSLIVAPLAFLPFLPLRRRLRTISDHLLEIKCQQAEALRLSTLARTRQDRLAETTRTELLKHKEDTGARIGALTREVQLLQRGLLDVQARADKEANENKEATRRDYMSMRGDVKALAHRVQVVADKEPTVSLSPQTLDEMALSLVDIAAFVEEVETLEGLERRGNDPRGVEKMRKLALKLHSLAGSVPQDGRQA